VVDDDKSHSSFDLHVPRPIDMMHLHQSMV